MESVSVQSSDDINSVLHQLHNKQELLLEAIANAPEKSPSVSVPPTGSDRPVVKTSYLTSTTGLANNNISHHVKKLIRAGLVERPNDELVPPDNSPGPQPENAYRCTETGLEAANFEEDYPIGESVEDLRDEYERQRREIATLNETIEALESKFEKIAGGHNNLVQNLEENGVVDGDQSSRSM